PSGAMAGGTTVVLTGTGFTSATQVLFGDVAATSYTVNSATQITVTAPAHAAGAMNVVVTTPFGTSFASPFALYSYLAATPAASRLSASSGTTAGGTTVTISGSNFSGATRVDFDGVPAAFTVNGDGSVTAVSPVHASGTIDVTVTTPSGTSSTGTATHFTYSAATGSPTLTSLGPTTPPPPR